MFGDAEDAGAWLLARNLVRDADSGLGSRLEGGFAVRRTCRTLYNNEILRAFQKLRVEVDGMDAS